MVQIEERITWASINVTHNTQVATNAKMAASMIGHLWYRDSSFNYNIKVRKVRGS